MAGDAVDILSYVTPVEVENCPVTVVTDVVKVTLVDQVIFHVAEHRGRTGSHATSGETAGV